MQLPAINNLLKNTQNKDYSKYLALMPDLKQEKSQKFITIVLTLGASIILGIFAISPTISTISGLQKQIDDSKFLDRQMQEKINNLSILQQKYADINSDLPIVYDAIPASPQLPIFLAQIQAIAKDSNITLNNFQSLQVDASPNSNSGEKYNSFDFGLTAQGEYLDFSGFLNKLVNFQRIVSINTISISKGNQGGTDTNTLQFSIRGTAYFKP